jgi:hypothetical protein
MAHELMQFFTYEHLKDGALKDASRPFCELARQIDSVPPEAMPTAGRDMLWGFHNEYEEAFPLRNTECCWALIKLKSAALAIQQHEARDNLRNVHASVLRYLLEAQDCAVRAVLWKHVT